MLIARINGDIFRDHATTTAAWPPQQQHNIRPGEELTSPTTTHSTQQLRLLKAAVICEQENRLDRWNIYWSVPGGDIWQCVIIIGFITTSHWSDLKKYCTRPHLSECRYFQCCHWCLSLCKVKMSNFVNYCGCYLNIYLILQTIFSNFIYWV